MRQFSECFFFLHFGVIRYTMANHFHVNTPLLESVSMSKRVGTAVYLKMENSQPSGSFKIRGIGHLCQQV